MSKIILPVTHRRQRHPADCVAACAAMALDYLNEPVEYDRLLRILRVEPEFGTAAFNIRLLEELGVTVIYRERGSLDEIRQHLENHLPCIAFLRTGDLPWWTWDTAHAVLIVGMNEWMASLGTRAPAGSPTATSRRWSGSSIWGMSRIGRHVRGWRRGSENNGSNELHGSVD